MIVLFVILLLFSSLFSSSPSLALETANIDFFCFQNKIKINTIIIRNSSILSQDQKTNISKTWQGEYELYEILSIGTEISSMLTKLYYDQGYKTSKIIVPEQDKLAQGIFIIEVIEGTIEDIVILGDTNLSRNYILSRIPAAQRTPLNIDNLANQLKNLSSDPLIKNLNSTLEKGSSKQSRILTLNVQTNPTQTLSMQGSNNASAGTGSEEGIFYYGNKNLFGGAEELIIQSNVSRGKKMGLVFFSIPVTSQNTRLRFRGQIESNDIIIQPLADFDFENDVETYGVDLIHPLYEDSNNFIDVSVSYDDNKSQTYILGERFEIDERFPRGIAQYNIVRLSPSWSYRTNTTFLKFTPQFSFGVDRSFFYSRFFVDFSHFLSENLSVSGNFYGQFADDILFPQEQCKIGGNGLGNGSIRGYAQQAFRNDNCVAFSLQSSWSFYQSESLGLKLELSPFFQLGSVKKSRGDSLIPEETLASVGLELGVIFGNFFFKVYSAKPLVNVDSEFEEPFGLTGGLIIKY